MAISRPMERRGQPPAARTWSAYQIDLVGDRSDAPRLPVRQVRRLHPQGLDVEAAQAWSLLTPPTRSTYRRPRPRLAAGAIGATVAGAVTSPVIFDVALAVARIALDGFAARLAAVAGVVVVVVPILWRLARWGAEPKGWGL